MNFAKIRKAVIPAAGLGTRFLPITKAVPKPMLPILDKPTIQYIAEELYAVGIKDIIIIVSPDSDVIVKHFGRALTLENRLIDEKKEKLIEIEKETRNFNINFVVQDKPNGLGGALLCAESFLCGEPFVLLLGDELIYNTKDEKPCIKTLVDLYNKTGKNVIATMQVFGDDLSKYGNIGIKCEHNGILEVNDVIEKPSINEALSNSAIIGRYVFTEDLFVYLKQCHQCGNELCLTEAFKKLAKSDKLIATEFEGKRYDVGDKLGFIKANIEYSLRNDELKQDLTEYIKNLAKNL